MSYATLTELKLRLGTQVTPPGLYEQLTDRLAQTTANDTVGAEILAAAHGEVDGWISKRYAVPIAVSADATLAARLNGATLALAVLIAWETGASRRRTPQNVRDAATAIRDWLAAVAAGTVSLPGASEIPGATADGPGATAMGHTRVFTEEAMEGL